MWVTTKWYKILTSGGFDILYLTGSEMFKVYVDETGQMIRSVLNGGMMVILMLLYMVILDMMMLLMVILDMMRIMMTMLNLIMMLL